MPIRTNSRKHKPSKKHTKTGKQVFAFLFDLAGSSGQTLGGCTSNTNQTVQFSNAGPFCGLSISTNGAQIITPGVYEANYIVNTLGSGNSGSGTNEAETDTAAASFQLLRNGASIPGSVFFADLGDQVVGQVKFVACPGDLIQLANNNLTSVTLPGMSATNNNVATAPPFVGAHGSTALLDLVNGVTSISQSLTLSATSSVYAFVEAPVVAPNTITITDQNGTTAMTLINMGTDGEAYFIDQVPAGPITVTANFTTFVSFAGLQVVQVLNTATPSWDASANGQTSYAGGPTSSFSVPVFPSTNNELGLMAFTADEHTADSNTALDVPPSFVLDQNSFGARGTVILLGDVQRTLSLPGSTSIDVAFTTPVTTALGISVAVKPFAGTSIPTLCEPFTRASLDLKLLEPLPLCKSKSKSKHRRHTHTHKHSK